MKRRNLLALVSLSAMLSGLSAGAADQQGSSGSRSNSLSDRPRSSQSPPVVESPPSGAPSGAMTTSDSSGNAMAQKDRFHAAGKAGNGMAREDKTASRSSAPARGHAGYGEDIPALRGLQASVALNRLHHINSLEIERAKMAESKAKSPEVLRLAHQIRADHEALEKKVEAVADERGIKLESFRAATYEKAVNDRLSDLEGKGFETAFLRINQRGHEMAARDLRADRGNIQDEAVRSLIGEALPAIDAHRKAPTPMKGRASTEEEEIGD